MNRILLVEDERDIRQLIALQLKSCGHEVEVAVDGNEALDLIQARDFDIFVIDRMLPGANGVEICKFIRKFKKTKNHPILFVTALARNEEVIEGLDAGADDYVTKPFDMDVLIARVRSLLRRSDLNKNVTEKNSGNELKIGKIRIDLDQCKVWIDEVEYSFTVSEYKLLCYMIKNARKVMSREELVHYIQGEEVHVTERTIDTHVFGLRKKMGSAAWMIETIRGIGYRVNDDE